MPRETRPLVVCVGRANRDTIALVAERPPEDGRVRALDVRTAGGGPAATAAVALARLGVPVAFVGALGDDESGEATRQELADEGVDVRDVTLVRDARSPESVILVDGSTGARSICAYPGTAGAVEISAGAAERIAAAEWVHTDHVGYAAAHAVVRKAGGPRLSIDEGSPIEDLDLRGVDLYAPALAMLSRRYPELEAGAAMAVAREGGATAVVTTLGADGVRTLDAEGAESRVPAYGTDIVSTLGAGDVFHGALVAALLDGRALRDAAAWASVVAALSCGAVDGRSGIPTHDAADRAFAAWEHAAGGEAAA